MVTVAIAVMFSNCVLYAAFSANLEQIAPQRSGRIFLFRIRSQLLLHGGAK